MLDHNRFPYSPLPERPVLRLPQEARVAVWVIPNVEYFAFDRPATSVNPACSHLVPDVLNFSWRDYGTRVGIWRLMEILDEAGFRGTVALNALVCEHFPQFVRAAAGLGWEFMGHCLTNSQSLAGLEEEEERGIIRSSVETLRRHTGQAPRGWLGSSLAENFRTPDLLAECGLEYVCDWVNDEQPYYMRTSRGPLVAMPYTIELNDIQIFLRGGHTGEEYLRMITDQFDVLYEEGRKTAKVLGLSLHPFITGVPFRSRYLSRALRYIASHRDVWLATGGEIVSWFKKTVSP